MLDINLSCHIISSSATLVTLFMNLCVSVKSTWDVWFQMVWVKHLQFSLGAYFSLTLQLWPGNEMKLFPRAIKEATLRPILKPFPVS